MTEKFNLGSFIVGAVVGTLVLLIIEACAGLATKNHPNLNNEVQGIQTQLQGLRWRIEKLEKGNKE